MNRYLIAGVLFVMATAVAVVATMYFGGLGFFAASSPPAQPTVAEHNHKHSSMPNMPADGSEEERKLFLEPGGIYTAKDIKANGDTVPSVKFKNLRWPHDRIEKAGDPICPVTDKRSDPRCTWVVNGETYQFCCPPCLTQFVEDAKDSERNAKIKKPGEYVATESMIGK